MQVQEIKLKYNNKMLLDDAPKICQSDLAAKIFRKYMKEEILYKESVYAIYLSQNLKVKGIFKVSEGSIGASIADIRIILGVALKSFSSGIILAHNHPSSSLIPSSKDIELTTQLREACKIMNIRLIDHLIITKNEYKSIINE